VRLSDSAIRERIESGSIVFAPSVGDKAIQPTSIDLRLGQSILSYESWRSLDPREGSAGLEVVSDTGDYLISPGEFVLGSTLERVEVPYDLVGIVEGKSSLGRLGLAVHITAGFIDPGFRGHITLELKNVNRVAIRLYPEMFICQLCFETIYGKVLRPYGSVGLGSKYQDSVGTIGAKASER